MPRARSRRSASASSVRSCRSDRSRTVASGRAVPASGQAELHVERHQLLLRAVVDVPLQRLRPGILCGDDPPARLAEVLDQPRVPQHQPGLGREVLDELRLGDPWDRSPASTPTGRRGARPGAGPRTASCRRSAGSPSPGSGTASPSRPRAATPPPAGADPRATARRARVRADRPAQDVGHPRKDVLGGVGVRQPLGELREHLVRRGPAPVHHAVGETAGEPSCRDEQRRDDGRRHEDRQEARARSQRPPPRWG